MIAFVHGFLDFHQFDGNSNHKIASYCDNLGVVDNCNKTQDNDWTWYPSQCARDNYDVLALIDALSNQISITITLEHLKGHTDDFTPFEELTRPEQLNVLADELATKQHNEMDESTLIRNQNPHLPSHNARLYINNRLQTGKEKQTVLFAWAKKQQKHTCARNLAGTMQLSIASIGTQSAEHAEN